MLPTKSISLPTFSAIALALGVAFAINFSGAPAQASIAATTRAYNGCMTFLKLPRAKQIQVARRTPYSLTQTLNACNLMKRNGLAKSIYYDGQYQQWKKDRDAWERANRSNDDDSGSSSTSSDDGRSSSSASGTCYVDNNCTSSGTQTSSRISCPGSTGSFKSSIGSSCEPY